MKIILDLTLEERREILTAIRKQEKRKPCWENGHTSCPNCGTRVLYEINRYCQTCGQKMDWQEVEG